MSSYHSNSGCSLVFFVVLFTAIVIAAMVS